MRVRTIPRQCLEIGCRITASWGAEASCGLVGYAWIAAMFCLLAFLNSNRFGLYLVPPFGASLSILLLLPEADIAQPYPLIAGSVVGASVGTVFALFAHGLVMAVVAAVVALFVLCLGRAYHPPGVALAMYPLLLYPGHWFPLQVVLPFAVVAVGSTAILSRLVAEWPAYPRPLAPRHGATGAD